MRSRLKIETVLFCILALTGLCAGQTTRSLSGFQTRSCGGFAAAHPFGLKFTPDGSSTSRKPAGQDPAGQDFDQGCSALNPPGHGQLSIESESLCTETPGCTACLESQQEDPSSTSGTGTQPTDTGNNIGDNEKSSSVPVVRSQNQPAYHDAIYYRNKLEFAFDGGWLPINIPFVFDVFLGDSYNKTPLSYTLVPLVASLRWHIDDVGGPWIFRGNWDVAASGSITLIPRGPETHYFSYDMGVRRNFVPRRGKIAPYFDGRAGLGEIDAKGPLGVQFAQGQNFTFTLNLGSGVRYNLSPRYSFSGGLNWMHISNLYLSQPAFSNYGINVYGPMFGVDVRLGRPRHGSE
jgi:hypothetical protein